MRDSTRGWLGPVLGLAAAVCQKAENIFVKQRGAESRWMFAACSREQADLFAGFFHGWQIAPHRSFVFGHFCQLISARPSARQGQTHQSKPRLSLLGKYS